MDADDTEWGLESLTASFCDGVRGCTALLPPALGAVVDGEAEAFAETAADAAAVESTCDERIRALRDHFVELDPTLTGVYLQARDLLELFSRLDAVANAVEDALAGLASMEPSLGPAGEPLGELAELAAASAARLADAVESYVRALCTGEPSRVDRDAVEAVRDAENRCDDLKRGALAAAFAPGLSVNGLAIREVTLALDAVPNAVEDAADYLSFLGNVAP